MIEEEMFKSILSIARRILDVYGHHETADSARIIYTEGDLNIGREDGVIEIIFRGSLVFRHDQKGEITDYYEEHGVWMEEFERVSRQIPRDTSGTANKKAVKKRGKKGRPEMIRVLVPKPHRGPLQKPKDEKASGTDEKVSVKASKEDSKK